MTGKAIVSGMPAVLKAYDKATLKVKAPMQGTVSVAVRGKGHSSKTINDGDMLTERLRCRQIR